MNRRLLQTAAVAMSLQLPSAQARTFHVAPDGADTYSGTPEAPLRTLQRAADLAWAGDTVLVHNGVYRGGVVLWFFGEPDKPIVFKSASRQAPCGGRARAGPHRAPLRGRLAKAQRLDHR